MSNEETKQPEQKPQRRRSLLHRIINVFLYIGVGTLGFLILLFGFSQTQTFRNWLRNFVVEQANENLNGTVSIEKIEGTIFTSLILRNTVVAMEKDTLLNAGMIEVKTSPLKLLLKTIYVRKVEIKNTRIAFIKDSSGELNISKLFPPSDDEDTSKSHFPFRIEAADLKLTNVDFSLQNYDKTGSKEFYSFMNMDDFRVEDIFLSLEAFADIDNNKYEVKIEDLKAAPNINAVELKSFSGEFGVSPNELLVNNLSISTINSEIYLNVKINGLNIFDSTAADDLNYAPIDLSLDSRKFNFNELASIVPSIDMLKGAVAVQLNASGNLLQMDLNKIIIDYEKTHLETKATLRNVMQASEMNISTSFTNSYINQSDVNKLLPEYGIPSFDKLGLVKIDTLTFDGQPLNFKSKILLSAGDGQIFSNVKMDLTKAITEYEIDFSSRNLDLLPVANISSKLNLAGNVTGKGFSPKEMNSNIVLTANSSEIEGIRLDSLSLTAEARNGELEYSLLTLSNKAKANINGDLNFQNENLTYSAIGFANNIDIGALTKDSALSTDLNFNFKAEGEGVDIDKMNAYLTFDLSKSRINDAEIDRLRTITDIFTDNNDERVINFISDVADVTLKGQFSLLEAVSVVSQETAFLLDAFLRKTGEVIPSAEVKNYFDEKNKINPISSKLNIQSDDKVTITYLADLKNFDILSPFLDNKRLEIDGDVSGNLMYDKNSIQISLNSDLNFVKYWGNEDVYFLSKMSANLNIANSIFAVSTEDIDIDAHIETARVFAGTDVHDILFDLDFKKNIAGIKSAFKLEDYVSAKIACTADITTSVIKLDASDFYLNYKNFDIKNRDNLQLAFSEDRIEFQKFNLFHANGRFSADGFLSRNEGQDLNLKLENISGKDLFPMFSNGNGLSSLDLNLNLTAEIKGSYSNPIITVGLTGNNLTFKEKMFGNLRGDFNYTDKIFSSDIKYFEVDSRSMSPVLKVTGRIPINLSFTDSGKRLIDDEDIFIDLTADNLDLTPYGELIPGVSKFKGRLNSNLEINGSINEPYPDGYLRLDNASFLLKFNNLQYDAGIKINVAKDILSVDSLLIANSVNTKGAGRITGGGKAELENFNITSSQFVLNGSLKVMGDETKYVSPNLYGDLIISTNGNFELLADKDGAMLTAPINIDVAKLTYSQAQSSYTSSSDNYIYKFVQDTIKSDSKTLDFEKLVSLSKQSSTEEQQQAAKPSKFDYSIDVQVEDEAELTYVLSREFNQNLVAVLRGNFQYEKIGIKPVAQGELELLEGSTLEFIKTLNAEGKIRFESELSNPYLDITAIYKNYYYPLESTSATQGETGGDEIEVAVKMNIKGPLKELDKNLARQSEKLTVYYGAENIENNQPDKSKDASDAVMFMLLGKFKDDSKSQQELIEFDSYATSFAGSLVGGFLNRQLGDYVKSLEIRQTGTDTKFILAGRAGKFRYSIGGSTAVFQDLGVANVKIEYPISRSFFMRLERKEALSETKYLNEMINEVGLKYRFEF